MRRWMQFLLLCLLGLNNDGIAFADVKPCNGARAIKKPWQFGEAVLFRANVLNVDADGAPTAYLVNGKGLSYTCDGVVALENGTRITPDSHPKDWQQKCNLAWQKAKESGDYSQLAIFGFETDAQHIPRIQRAGDPLPGEGYVSATSVTIPGTPEGTQRRYVDALRIPYIVLPPVFNAKYKVKAGAMAIVYRIKTEKYAFGVFADSGGLGEASIKLHQDLGGKPIIKLKGIDRAKSRIDDPVLFIVFPQTIAAPQLDAQPGIR
jgi:hypothetical protein